MLDPLKKMGGQFDALVARWARMEFGEERDDLCELLNERSAAIRAMPVNDLVDLAIKARAVAWTANLDRREPEDYLGSVVHAFIEDVEHVASMRAWQGIL